MSRGRPTDLELRRRQQPARMLSRVGEIDLNQEDTPNQLINLVSTLMDLINIYRKDGGKKMAIYVRRIDED